MRIVKAVGGIDAGIVGGEQEVVQEKKKGVCGVQRVVLAVGP